MRQVVHPAIYVRFHRSIKSGALVLTETPKNQDTAQSFQRTLQVGHCLIASGPADLSVGFCTVAIVTPTCNFGGGCGLGRGGPDQHPWAAAGHTARHGAQEVADGTAS